MSKKERIAELERRVSDLEAEVRLLRLRRPADTPPPNETPYVWPGPHAPHDYSPFWIAKEYRVET